MIHRSNAQYIQTTAISKFQHLGSVAAATLPGGSAKALLQIVLLTVGISFAATATCAGQSAHRTRRESNANRKARIARTIAETYGQKFEVAGGGGYLRFRSGPYQRRDNQVTFWASTLYALNPKLGIVGEVRGGFGKANVGNILPSGNVLDYNPRISEYNFMAGPSYRLVRKEKYSVSLFAEGGAGLGKFDGDSKGLSAADIGVWTGTYAASFTGGLNLDYNLYPNLAFRVTPSYLGTTFGGTVQNSKNLNVGVLYRFGKKQ